MHRVFSEKGFSRCLRAGDSRRFRVNLRNDRDKVIANAINAATTAPIGFTDIHQLRINDRPCTSLRNYSQTLILRSISKFLARRFRITPRHRDEIVKDVIETLSDSTPMYVLRRDIRSFYETLPTAKVGQRILYDTFMPTRLKAFIRKYFDTFCAQPDTGVPRGIGLSSVIAELAMQSSDQRIREIPGVYKYFRYADDILVFSFKPPAEVADRLREALPETLRFNEKKSTNTDVACRDKRACIQKSFEYLGYRFSFNDYCGQGSPREVAVSISEKKIAKVKARIIASMKSYAMNHAKLDESRLLYNRIRFLSSNYRAYRNGASFVKTSKILSSGLYYSYSLCGTYKGGQKKEHDCAELKALDGFYHSLLKGPSSSFRALLVGTTLLKRLEEISFFMGYRKRMMVRFDVDQLQQIKKVWRNG